MICNRPAAASALLICLAGAFGAEPVVAQGIPEREESLVVHGNDPCPRSSGDDIVVCARRPESERYRIPPALRGGDRPSEVSWGSRVAALEDAARDQRPNSCSVVGSWGQTGCISQRIRQWYAERRARPRSR